jgi:hypothetical protein
MLVGEGRHRDDWDVARDLADIAAHIASLKGEAAA